MSKKFLRSFSNPFNKTVLASSLLIALTGGAVHAATVDLRILETSDLHANMMDYDYYKLESTDRSGLTRTASLIKQAREESLNSVLVDNGDLIQGSPLGDYIANKGLNEGELHPVFLALNSLGYAVGTYGNHEFNYGLEFLDRAVKGANFPYVNANILDANTQKPYFTPYLIQPTEVKDKDGNNLTLNIGYIGFVAPQIVTWDKQHLEGKVITEDIVETAKKWVPEMREKGADIIIAINHSGIDGSGYTKGMENAGYYLAEVEGIDVVLTGHAHSVFPGSKFAELKNVDLEKGLINGKPAVMPGFWGDHLGVVDLTLNNSDGKWLVTDAKAVARPIFDAKEKVALVEPDQQLTELLKPAHQATIDFVNQPIGKSSENIYGYLALVQDSATIQVVNDAQRDYVESFLAKDSSLEKLPVLSAAAPFKAGGRDSYAVSYTEVDKGDLTYRNAADLYIYPNTLTVVKVSGAELKQWLECSAGQFNQIDLQSDVPQELINFDGFRSYNFDVIDGVNYQIDISQPARYNGDCELINPEASRIVNLTFDGKPVDENAHFYVATNNYRGFGGKFAGTGSDHVVIAAPDENRTILSDYIAAQTQANGELKIEVDNNWQLAPLKMDNNQGDKKLDIRFGTAGHEKAHNFVKDHAKVKLTSVSRDEAGIEMYKLDLQ